MVIRHRNFPYSIFSLFNFVLKRLSSRQTGSPERRRGDQRVFLNLANDEARLGTTFDVVPARWRIRSFRLRTVFVWMYEDGNKCGWCKVLLCFLTWFCVCLAVILRFRYVLWLLTTQQHCPNWQTTRRRCPPVQTQTNVLLPKTKRTASEKLCRV